MASTAKLLVLQGGRCFYCRQPLTLEEATLEHIVPKAQGGDATEANTVACCAAMNHLLGNASAKEKISAILNAGGSLTCPRNGAKPSPSSPAQQAIPKPEKALVALSGPLAEAFEAASKANNGEKAHLSVLGLELRKRVAGFEPKHYGHKLFGQLVKKLGYPVEGQCALKKKE